jgi:predicted amidohydrolase
MKLKLALAQTNTKLGVVESNLEKHLMLIEKAVDEKADLIIFPELSLTGYYLQDLTPTVSHRAVPEDPVFSCLMGASKEIDMVVGFVEEDLRNRFFISSAYLSGGMVSHVHRKVYLPTYGLFDEGRFFAWGDSTEAFNTSYGRVGILICEDFWHVSPPYLLWLDGADIFIFISASPSRGLTNEPQLKTTRWVESITRAYASIFTSFVIHCNRVGYEDGLHFSGGSTVNDPDGSLVAQAPYDQESLTFCEIDLNQLHRSRSQLPLLRDERTALTKRELNRILSRDGSTSGR